MQVFVLLVLTLTEDRKAGYLIAAKLYEMHG